MENHLSSWSTGLHKRKARPMLSCLPCHQRKIKCDRGTPCERCVVSGRSDDCAYQTTEPPFNASPRPDFPVVAGFVNGKARLGTFHSWAKLCWDFEEARPYLFGLDAEYRATYENVKSFKSLFSPKASNQTEISDFAFTQAPTQSVVDILSYLPDRNTVDVLIHHYRRTFNQVLPLWTELDMDFEIGQFWKRPESSSLTTFAQLFLMLSLSCHSAPVNEHALCKHDLPLMSKTFFMIGQVAFNKSCFKTFHDLAGLRALCMITMTKVMDLGAASATQDCTLVLGMTVRAAQNMALHRHPRLFSGISKSEGNARVVIWTTIVFMDQLVSVHSNLPTIIRHEEYDARFEVSDKSGPKGTTTGLGVQTAEANNDEPHMPFLALMAKLLPIVSTVLSKLNMIQPSLCYEEVEELDKNLRSVLLDTNQLTNKNTDACGFGVSPQRDLLQVFIRRILMNLHQPFATNSEAAIGVERSRLAVLECALSLMVCQNGVYESANLNGENKCLLELLKEDFGLAIIHVSLGIRQGHFDVSPPIPLQNSPKEIAWAALKRSAELTARFAGRSLRHFRVYVGCVYLVAALEALEYEVPVMEKMREAGQNIIQSMSKHIPHEFHDIYGSSDIDVMDIAGMDYIEPPHATSDSSQDGSCFFII